MAIVDETGNTYGKLTVIEYAGANSRHHATWRCKCDCGNEIIATGGHLRCGGVKSCGCLRNQLVNEIGKRYGGLVVLERGYTAAGRPGWLCQCDCGGTRVIDGFRLRNGDRKSCGCLHHRVGMNVIDETGKRYGKLTVLARAENAKHGQVQWLCRCDCGNEAVVRGTCLRRRRGTKTCGCHHQDQILPNGLAAQRKLLYVYKTNAKKRDLEWSLTDDEFYGLTREPCHYCGAPPMQVQKTQATSDDYVYNGVDRLDNAMGYVVGNVVPCCGVCNRMKMAMSDKEFLDMIERIYEHRIATPSSRSRSVHP
jgi:hypothetical protein